MIYYAILFRNIFGFFRIRRKIFMHSTKTVSRSQDVMLLPNIVLRLTNIYVFALFSSIYSIIYRIIYHICFFHHQQKACNFRHDQVISKHIICTGDMCRCVCISPVFLPFICPISVSCTGITLIFYTILCTVHPLLFSSIDTVSGKASPASVSDAGDVFI